MAQAQTKQEASTQRQTLSHFMGKGLYGWAVVEGFYLRYDHGLMEFTPVIRPDTREMIVCLKREVVDEIKQLLDTDRRHMVKIESGLFLTNGRIGFFLDKELRGRAVAVNVVTHQDVEHRCMGSVEPYRIA